MMKVMEETSGTGELLRNGQLLRPVHYRITRYQGVSAGSGLPIPGLFRIEGSIDQGSEFLGEPLGLRLEDGRVLGITIVDDSGRILSEGHGPSKCRCC